MNAHGFILPARIIGIIIILTSVLPLGGIGGWFFFDTRNFLQFATQTTGTVVDLQSSRDSEGDTMYTPVFEYQDGTGTTHKIISSWSSNPPSHLEGDAVDVLYDPANPSDARLDGYLSLWLGPIICGVLALFLLLFAMLFLWLVPFTIRRVWPSESDSLAA